MLVLSRKADEAILLGDGTKVTVLSIRGNQVRLGIEAPDWVTVLRAELVTSAEGRAEHDRRRPAAPASR